MRRTEELEAFLYWPLSLLFRETLSAVKIFAKICNFWKSIEKIVRETIYGGFKGDVQKSEGR